MFLEPLRSDLSEPKLKRAGLDYHDFVSVAVQADLDAALSSEPTASSRVFAFAHVTCWYADIESQPDDVLSHLQVTERVRILILDNRQSPNLANSVAVVTYKAWRQQGFLGVV